MVEGEEAGVVVEAGEAALINLITVELMVVVVVGNNTIPNNSHIQGNIYSKVATQVASINSRTHHLLRMASLKEVVRFTPQAPHLLPLATTHISTSNSIILDIKAHRNFLGSIMRKGLLNITLLTLNNNSNNSGKVAGMAVEDRNFMLMRQQGSLGLFPYSDIMYILDIKEGLLRLGLLLHREPGRREKHQNHPLHRWDKRKFAAFVLSLVLIAA